jgi:hypothetical protein
LTDSDIETVYAIVYASRLPVSESSGPALDTFLESISDLIPDAERGNKGDVPVVLRLALVFDPPVDVTQSFMPDETEMVIPASKQVFLACQKRAGSGRPYFPIVDTDSEKRVIKILVAEPDYIDKHDDQHTADAIEAGAHEWMMAWHDPSIRPDGKRPRINLFHDKDISDRVYPVESYVTDTDLVIGGHKLRKGSWILGFKIPDDEIWDMVKRGEIGGASYEGEADALIFDKRFIPPDTMAGAA